MTFGMIIPVPPNAPTNHPIAVPSYLPMEVPLSIPLMMLVLVVPTKTPADLPQYHLLYPGILHPLLHQQLHLPSLPHNLFLHNRPVISDKPLMEGVADSAAKEKEDNIVLSETAKSQLTFVELILAAKRSNIVSV